MISQDKGVSETTSCQKETMSDQQSYLFWLVCCSDSWRFFTLAPAAAAYSVSLIMLFRFRKVPLS